MSRHLSRAVIYDPLKYAELNPSGEISFHNLLQYATSAEITTAQENEAQESGPYILNADIVLTSYYQKVKRRCVISKTVLLSLKQIIYF